MSVFGQIVLTTTVSVLFRIAECEFPRVQRTHTGARRTIRWPHTIARTGRLSQTPGRSPHDVLCARLWEGLRPAFDRMVDSVSLVGDVEVVLHALSWSSCSRRCRRELTCERRKSRSRGRCAPLFWLVAHTCVVGADWGSRHCEPKRSGSSHRCLFVVEVLGFLTLVC